MRMLLALTLAALTAPAAAQEAGYPAEPDHIIAPVFAAAPSRAHVLAVYPPGARSLDGRVVMDCRVGRSGGLNRCRVVSEVPAGRGFGRAAQLLAPYFRLPTRTAAGGSVEGAAVRIPVTFSAGLEAEDRSVRAQWQVIPDAATAARLYPAAARLAGVDKGEAVLQCRLGVGGAVGDCGVARESPAGLGFGAAALAIAPHFRMRPWSADGQPVDGAPVRIPVIFERPGAAPAG